MLGVNGQSGKTIAIRALDEQAAVGRPSAATLPPKCPHRLTQEATGVRAGRQRRLIGAPRG